jgi:hypothetical protein
MRSQRAARGRVGDLLQPLERLDPLVQLQRRDQVVVVVGQRVGDRALVAVVRGEVEDVVELVLDRGEHAAVGDRALAHLEPVVGRDSLRLRREEGVDDDHPGRAVVEYRPYQVRFDEARAPDDEQRIADH